MSPLQRRKLLAESRYSVDNDQAIIRTGEAINGATTWYWLEYATHGSGQAEAYAWCIEIFGQEGSWHDGIWQQARWMNTNRVFYFSNSADRLAFLLRWG
jgi:hypothetical protein